MQLAYLYVRVSTENVNGKQRLFVAEYLKDKNASQAALRAGYSPKANRRSGYLLLKRPAIKKAIQAAFKKITDKCEVTAERVIEELGRIAFSDLRSLYRADGSLRPASEWQDDNARAVASIDTEEIFEGTGQDRKNIGNLRKLKLWSKNHALETLARHFKLLTDKVEVTDVTDYAKILRERREKLKRTDQAE